VNLVRAVVICSGSSNHGLWKRRSPDRLRVKIGGLSMKSLGSGWKFVAALVSALSMVTVNAQSAEKNPPSATATHSSRNAAATSKKKSALGHTTDGKVYRVSENTSTRRSGSSSKTHARANHSHAMAGGVVLPVATVESRRLSSAFIASAQLRPMAQQLIMERNPTGYAGVIAYAAGHTGEAAASADLAVGHAYMLDRRFPEAERAFKEASLHGTALDDYADYLEAQAAVQGNRTQDAIPLLNNFTDRHPGSLFDTLAPILLANAYLAGGDSSGALRVLQPLRDSSIGNHVDYRFVLAKAYQASGNSTQAASLYRGIYLGDPISPEAVSAKNQMATMNSPLSAADRKRHADAMFNAKQYMDAGEEYRALQKGGNDLSQSDRDALDIYAAVCDLRLKKLSRSDVEHLPVTGDDSAALKLYLQSELARNSGNTDEHDALVQQLMAQYPQSRWLEEALYSGGNMYLIRQNDAKAIDDYVALVEHFPNSTYAPSAHWHAAWLSYRLRRNPDAARLMDQQIMNYPAGVEIPGALYWRGRLYEDVEHDLSQALNYYNALNSDYVNSYYAILARQRIAVIGQRPAAVPAPALAAVRAVEDPHLTDVLPENDPHLIKARLLANAALNEYIRPEIQLSDTSGRWGAFAEAQIYESFGETTRALQAMKRSKLPFFSLPVSDVPMAYWQLVFPRPYWAQLESDSRANGVDPFLVAALIRQESEFNPEAVSRKSAYGLMQLLPSVGKSLAKKEGERHFNTSELLDPSTNLRLGTQDLRKSIDRYNGQVEYALAAYNAGDSPVHQWMSTNNYKDIAEWVESIPYTETREYVQGIVRNRELYRAVYSGH
jgi:soluble lytic murein transglycosylase